MWLFTIVSRVGVIAVGDAMAWAVKTDGTGFARTLGSSLHRLEPDDDLDESMSAHLWVSFALASFIIGVIPGPGVMCIVGYAIDSGRRTAMASVAGMAVGNIVTMSLSLAGVGALLAASTLAFSILKWAGALYLIGLGLATIMESRSRPDKAAPAKIISPSTAFRRNVAVGTFHPKTIVFFVAFAPQFIQAGRDYTPQAMILVLTFGLIVGCTDTIYAIATSKASRLVTRSGAGRWAKRASGGVLIAAGVATAARD